MKNYNKLVAKIQEAVPEIDLYYAIKKSTKGFGKEMEKAVNILRKYNTKMDITLEAVFITMIKNHIPIDISESIGADGICIVFKTINYVYYWKLNKPLEDQSDETKQFLIDLIVK